MRTPRAQSIRTATLVAIIFGSLAPIGWAAARGTKPRGEDTTRQAQIERGKYLVTIGGCNDCHTPWKMGEHGPEPDMSRMLSGHPETMAMPPGPKADMPWGATAAATMTAWSGPWGVSFTANLTPDPSGLGAWNEDIFINTMRTGKHWGQSRPILPPMPWFNYGKMTDDDLKAVFAYLQSIPPVHNNVPLPIPPGGGEVAKTVWD
jgi:mono/diheme cytochrome c family protein